MDDILVIMEILKYFDFKELCIAERINPYFKSCVQSVLRRLRYVDFHRIFTGCSIKVMEKIQAYCSGVCYLNNLDNVILEKLTVLNIDSAFIGILGWENALSIVENSRNLRQLNAHISRYQSLDSKLLQKIDKVIIGHSAMTKLHIHQVDDLWIGLSSCRNLTHFTYRERTNFLKYEQLCALLDANLNLESLDIDHVSHTNSQLIEKLSVKTSKVTQNSSPLSPFNVALYRIVFDKFSLYDQIEYLTIRFHLPFLRQCFMYNELSKMVNLKYFRLQSNNLRSEDVDQVGELRKLKFVRWSENDAAALKMMRCSSSLEGFILNVYQIASPAFFDLIFHQCPNLQHPICNVCGLCNYVDPDSSITIPSIVDDLIHLVENLPNLRQLCIRNEVYNLLLRQEPMKRLCRRKRLLVIASRFSGAEEDLILEWIHLCYQDKSM
uniref:F-box domain-containing protein n=1 Tax=Romanomermis culicivorax TaxID=13658 RepID=A0A915KMW0_ROMCU